MSWRRFAPGILLGAALLCVPPRCGSPMTEYFIKLEWGSYTQDLMSWHGRVKLGGVQLLQAVPYVFEEGDTLKQDGLEFVTGEDQLLTDGLLLWVRSADEGSLQVATDHGAVSLSLGSMPLDEAQTYTLAGAAYLEAAQITRDEWNTAISYNTRVTSREDALPEDAYYAALDLFRADSLESRDSILARANDMYANDAWFRNAEDIRRAVNQQIYVTVPSVLAVGETFDLTVAAFDVNGQLVTDFKGPLLVTIEGESLSLPAIIQLTPGYVSLQTFPDVGRALQAGYARVVVRDPSGRFAPGAIPVRVEEEPTERVYWGDLHTHSYLSDGDFRDRGPEEIYGFGRDIGRLDFQALSDHDYRRPIPDWKWPLERAAAQKYYQPGRFVTLLGYEWSGEDLRFSDVMSHKNVYFRDADGPIYSAFDQRYNTPAKLWAALRQYPGVGKAFTVPHHPVRSMATSLEDPWYGGAGTDWSYHDPELQPLVEVYSRWGISESTAADNPRPVKDARDTGSAQYALSLGYQLGFIADSDTHDGTPGVSVLPARLTINTYPVGVVAVFAPALTREDIFDGLYSKRCYGTSGARRMLLDLRTTEGVRAGESANILGAPAFQIAVAGTTELSSVELVREDGRGVAVVWQGSSSGFLLETTVADPAFDRQAAYYLRVTQVDTEMGWIGPIFLSAR